MQGQFLHLFIHDKTGQITQDGGGGSPHGQLVIVGSYNGQQGRKLVIEGEGRSHKDISHPVYRKIMKKILKVNVQHEFLSHMDTCI